MKVNPKIAIAGGLAAVVLIGIIVNVASSDGNGGGKGSASKPGSGESEPAVFAEWKKAGHWVGDFKPFAESIGGGSCIEGTVDGLEVIHCSYSDEKAAEAAKEAALAHVGDSTGTALANGGPVDTANVSLSWTVTVSPSGSGRNLTVNATYNTAQGTRTEVLTTYIEC